MMAKLSLVLLSLSVALLVIGSTCLPLNDDDDQETNVSQRQPKPKLPFTSADSLQTRSQTRLIDPIRPASFYEGRMIDTRELKSVKGASKMDLSDMFREAVDDYPEEEIKDLLNKTPSALKEFHNLANTPMDPRVNLTYRDSNNPPEIDVKYANFNEPTREEKVCRSTVRRITPKKAFRPNSPPVYIPNDHEFVQVVEAEICETPDQGCSYLQDSIPYGMESFCVQKYAYQRLLYVDPLEKKLATDLFRFPSCCTCHVRQLPYDLRSSNANSSTTISPPELNMHSPSENMDETVAHKSQGDPIPLNDDPSVYKQQALHTEASANGRRQPKALRAAEDLKAPKLSTTSRPKPKRPTQTVILQEDKVYTSESDSRK